MPERTITEAELADYLETVNGQRRDIALDLAAGAISYAQRLREPEYEPGGVYVDACGTPLRYTDDGQWEAFGREGKHSHGFPLPPLRRLMPEETGRERL